MASTALNRVTSRISLIKNLWGDNMSSRSNLMKVSERFKSSVNTVKKKYVIPSLKKTPTVENVNPVILYEHNNKSHVATVRAMAFLQGLFWINYGHLAYTKLGKQDEETGEVKLYEEWQRSLALAMSVILGAVFGGGLLLYTKRCIFRATLLPKDNLVKVESDRWPFRDSVELVSSAKLGSNVSVQDVKAGSKSIINNRFLLQTADRQKLFILDTRGQFPSPKLFDSLFHKPRNFS